MFNVITNRELLVARLRKEMTYLRSDFSTSRRQKIQPFVVVCRQRTGSNMLRYALESHPQVVHYGELFHTDREKIWGAYGKYLFRPGRLIGWRNSDARSFLNNVIYRDTRPPVRAVGFKLFYRHGRTAGNGNPWPVIRERNDARIIHLVRMNPIASYLSFERIERAQRHQPTVQMRTSARARGTETANDDAIVVDVPRFKDYLIEYEIDIRTLIEEFGTRRILELSYESLCSDTEETIYSTLAFLGVDRRRLRVQTVRQSQGNIVRRIANLDEVAAAHHGTRWEAVPDQW